MFAHAIRSCKISRVGKYNTVCHIVSPAAVGFIFIPCNNINNTEKKKKYGKKQNTARYAAILNTRPGDEKYPNDKPSSRVRFYTIH